MLHTKVTDTAKTKVYLFSYDLGARLAGARKLEAIHLPDELPLEVALELDKKQVETFKNPLNLALLDRKLDALKEKYADEIHQALLDANTKVLEYVEEGLAKEIAGQLPVWNAEFLNELKTLETRFEKKAADAVLAFLSTIAMDKKALRSFHWRERFSILVPASGLIIGVAMLATAPFAGPIAIPAIYGAIKSGVKLINNTALIFEEMEKTIEEAQTSAEALMEKYRQAGALRGGQAAGEAAKVALNSLTGLEGGKFGATTIKRAIELLQAAKGKRLDINRDATRLAQRMEGGLRELPQLGAEILQYAAKRKSGDVERRRVEANLKFEEKLLERQIHLLLTSAIGLQERSDAAATHIARLQELILSLQPLTDGKRWVALDVTLKSVEIGLAFADPKPIEIAKNLTPAAGLLVTEEIVARVFKGTPLVDAKAVAPAEQL